MEETLILRGAHVSHFHFLEDRLDIALDTVVPDRDLSIKGFATYFRERNSEGSTQPVGLKARNGLGLFDMSGNVWEWCQDVYAPESHAVRGRERLEQTRDVRERVIRGASWNLEAWSARCSRRFGFREDYFGAGLGFRLASDGEAGIKRL